MNEDSSDACFCLSSFCGSPAIKSSILRCHNNLNLTLPSPKVSKQLWPNFAIIYLNEGEHSISSSPTCVGKRNICDKEAGNFDKAIKETHALWL